MCTNEVLSDAVNVFSIFCCCCKFRIVYVWDAPHLADCVHTANIIIKYKVSATRVKPWWRWFLMWLYRKILLTILYLDDRRITLMFDHDTTTMAVDNILRRYRETILCSDNRSSIVALQLLVAEPMSKGGRHGWDYFLRALRWCWISSRHNLASKKLFCVKKARKRPGVFVTPGILHVPT